MTITQLIYFTAVAEELNITKVADRFHVSQPAISSAVRELEKEFNITLFERRHNELSLTALGNTTYQRAKKLIGHYEEFQNELKELKNDKLISLAIAPNIASVHLSQLFLYMKKRMPDAAITIEENHIINMTQMLKNNLLDAACFACLDDRKDPALTYVHIGSFSLTLCAASTLLPAQKQVIEPHELENIPMVFQYKSSQLNTNIFKYFSQFHIIPNVIFYANQLTTILDFVRSGIAVGFLPPELLAREKEIIPHILPDYSLMSNMPIYFVYKNKTTITEELLHVFRAYFKLFKKE